MSRVDIGAKDFDPQSLSAILTSSVAAVSLQNGKTQPSADAAVNADAKAPIAVTVKQTLFRYQQDHNATYYIAIDKDPAKLVYFSTHQITVDNKNHIEVKASPDFFIKQINPHDPIASDKNCDELKYTQLFYPDAQKVDGVNLSEKDKQKKYWYLMMPRVPGIALADLDLENMGLAQRLQLAQLFMQAVLLCHQKGIVHRDLTPTNVMVDVKDQKVRLVDFGISVLLNATAEPRGVPPYLPPEALANFHSPHFENTEKYDVYAAGLILFKFIFQKKKEKKCQHFVPSHMRAALTANNQSTTQFVDLAVKDIQDDCLKTEKKEIVALIQSMLNPDFHKRPSIERVIEILNYLFEKAALEMEGKVDVSNMNAWACHQLNREVKPQGNNKISYPPETLARFKALCLYQQDKMQIRQLLLYFPQSKSNPSVNKMEAIVRKIAVQTIWNTKGRFNRNPPKGIEKLRDAKESWVACKQHAEKAIAKSGSRDAMTIEFYYCVQHFSGSTTQEIIRLVFTVFAMKWNLIRAIPDHQELDAFSLAPTP